MCEYCGCRQIAPLAELMDEHMALLDIASDVQIAIGHRDHGGAVAHLQRLAHLLDRHVRRMRAEYARRRAAVVAALGDLPLLGDTAGMHVVVALDRDTTRRVIERAAQRGVLLTDLEERYAGPPRVHGLVLGYGNATLTQVKAGCSLVAELIRELRASDRAGAAGPDRPGAGPRPVRDRPMPPPHRERSGAAGPPSAVPGR